MFAKLNCPILKNTERPRNKTAILDNQKEYEQIYNNFYKKTYQIYFLYIKVFSAGKVLCWEKFLSLTVPKE